MKPRSSRSFVVEPRGELAAEDLVEDQQVIEDGIRPGDPAVAGTITAWAPRPVEQEDPAAGGASSEAQPGQTARGPRPGRQSPVQLVGQGFRVDVAGDDDRRLGRGPRIAA